MAAKECATALHCIYELKHTEVLFNDSSVLHLSNERDIIADFEMAEGFKYEGDGTYKKRIAHRCS